MSTIDPDMSNRPFLAAFVTPILFSGRAIQEEEVALLLLLEPGALPGLLKAFDTADHMSRRFGSHTEFSYQNSVHLQELPPHLLPATSHGALGSDAIPVNAPLGLLDEAAPYRARLHVREEHLYWSVPPSGLRSGFLTGDVSRADVMEWRLLTATRRGVSGAFRRLSQREPYRALSILERGTCFTRSLTSPEAYRVQVPRDALDVLLGNEDARVRERAIIALRSKGLAPVAAGT